MSKTQTKQHKKIAGLTGAEEREINIDDLALATREVTPISALVAGRLEELQREAKSGRMKFAHRSESAE